MYLLKKLGQFFIYSNVFVSFCVLALCQSTSIIIGVSSSHLFPFVFFSTLFAYNFQRMVRFSPNKEQSAHLNWLNKNRLFIILITFISLSLSIYYALSLSFSTFYFLIPASIISLTYPIKIIPLGSQKVSLRELPRVKTTKYRLTKGRLNASSRLGMESSKPWSCFSVNRTAGRCRSKTN